MAGVGVGVGAGSGVVASGVTIDESCRTSGSTTYIAWITSPGRSATLPEIATAPNWGSEVRSARELAASRIASTGSTGVGVAEANRVVPPYDPPSIVGVSVAIARTGLGSSLQMSTVESIFWSFFQQPHPMLNVASCFFL